MSDLVYYFSLLLLFVLYLKIDKRIAIFHLFIGYTQIYTYSGLCQHYEIYVTLLVLNHLVIYWMILYLAGFSGKQIFILEITGICIAFYINAPEILQFNFQPGQHVDFMREIEKEMFIPAALFFGLSLTSHHNKKFSLTSFLLFVHVLRYAVAIPDLEYYILVSADWAIQERLADFYNIGWLVGAILYRIGIFHEGKNMDELENIKSLEDLEEFLRLRNLRYAAHGGMVELNKIAEKLFDPFVPKIIGIEDAD